MKAVPLNILEEKAKVHDANQAKPGTLTVTYGARSCTVSHVSRVTYDAVCTVLQRAAPAQE